MPRTWRSSTFTSELHQEFEHETSALLARRFVWFLWFVAGVSVISIVGFIARRIFGDGAAVLPPGLAARAWLLVVGFESLTILACIVCYRFVRDHRVDRAMLLKMTFWIVIFDGSLFIIERSVRFASAMPAAHWLDTLVVTHMFACIFLPWTPRQALRPMIPLLAINAGVVTVLSGFSVLSAAGLIALSLLYPLPGLFISWLKHSRRYEGFKLKFLQQRYGEMRRELVDARKIHEALFPPPIRVGPVRFSYRYEPMRQIGGDYLFAKTAPPEAGGALSIVVIDVTGHGIPAALTVNRLHGELERIFAESPGIDPGGVLSLLNRYVHLTLATHSVYVTAQCFRIDAGSMTYASGGHPPAFLRAVDGTIEQLDSTALVLGACAGEDFEPAPRTIPFGPGDTLIAYTDGANEARDADGRFLGIVGIQKLVAFGRPDEGGGWPAMILRAVEQHRQGPPADDTLIIEVSRPVGVEPASAPARAPSSAAVIG